MTDPAARLPHVGVVLLTQGKRLPELRHGLDTVLAQQEVKLDVVVVGNGWDPRELGLPPAVGAVALAENLGIPAGRNAGVSHVQGEWLFFLDDDASIPSPRFLADAIASMTADPSIGLLQPRVIDPTGLASPRRWVPRIRKGDPTESGPVFSVWEGAVVIPRSVFERTGEWAAPFFYAHEGIELAWRVWDQGLRAWYDGMLVAEHPAIAPTRHSFYYRLNARNRVWLARRNLPVPFRQLYVASWTGIQLLRWFRQPAALRAWFGGWWEGWRTDPGDVRLLSGRTIRRMWRAGRPPIV